MVGLRLRLPTHKIIYRVPDLLSDHLPPRFHCLAYSRRFAHIPSRRFTSVVSRLRHHQSSSQVPPVPELIPVEIPVDEERIPGYRPEPYYPAHPGDVLENRYRLVAKIGWGSSSTVWLARDLQSSRWLNAKKYVAIKICNCDVLEEDMTHELDINIHISSANPSYPGRGVLATAIGGYSIESPLGNTHLALIFDLVREPFWIFRRRITHQDSATHESLPLIKAHLKILLEGLDYMHTQGHIIHTDLKLDNIMVGFEDDSTIETFVQAQATHPMARKIVNGRTVYRCHNDFGPVMKGLGQMIPQITDFGLAQRGDRATPLIHPIQPNELRAPEVILGTGWSYSADIWNFGAVIWQLLDGQSLFRQPGTRAYSPAQHLADMIAIVGDMPPSLSRRSREMHHLWWSPHTKNAEGKLCNNAMEFYGGPFFTDDGTFMYHHLVPQSRKLERELPRCILEGNQTDDFVRFMRRMLSWVPEERATAAELVHDPWLAPARNRTASARGH